MDNVSTISRPSFTVSDKSKLAYRFCPQANDSNQPDELESTHVVFCGGFHSNMLGTKAQKLEEICRRHKFSYTRFDYRGHGESEGDPASFNLIDWLHDTLLILDNIQGRVILVGSSMGGWLATVAATLRPAKIKGLLLLASAPDFLLELIEPRLSKSESWDLQQGLIVNLQNNYGKPFPLTQKLLDSGKSLSIFKPSLSEISVDSEPGVEQLACPIRLIHGTADTDVPYELSIRLMNEFKQSQAQLTLLHQADHRLSDERSLACIEQQLLSLISDLHNCARS